MKGRSWLLGAGGLSVAVFALASGSPTLPAADPKLQRYSNEQLIDRLSTCGMGQLTGRLWGAEPTGFGVLDPAIELGAPDTSVPIVVAELRELVRRGPSALPALLDHVSDSRPTKLVFYVGNGSGPSEGAGAWISDEYDGRAVAGRAGVNLGAKLALDRAGEYVVTVGDLCYVAVGQIVNRRLFVFSFLGRGFHGDHDYNGAVFGVPPYGFRFIDSPVANPALAAAVRADWQALGSAGLEANLTTDLGSDRTSPGALIRLMTYYPADGNKLIHDHIQGMLAQGGELNFWKIDPLISQVRPEWADGLSSDLLALARRALDQDRRFMEFADARQNPLTWGPAAGVTTALLPLVHRGHDDELRSIAIEEQTRLEQQKAAVPAPSPAFDYHLAAVGQLLRRLDGRPNSSAAPPAEIPMIPPPPGASVQFDGFKGRMGRPPMIVGFLHLAGLPPEQVRAERIVVEEAVDDTGFMVANDARDHVVRSGFEPATVGRTDDSVLTANAPPKLELMLNWPPGPAHRLITLRGYVTALVPGLDPAAHGDLAHAARGAATHVVAGPKLAAARVQITIFSTTEANAAFAGSTSGGPAAYGARPPFDGHPPPGIPPSLIKPTQVSDDDVVLAIDDPDRRLVSMEWVAADGRPLTYNHNGWYHAQSEAGRRLDIFRLPPGARTEAALVVDLITEKDLIKVPFAFADLTLPPR